MSEGVRDAAKKEFVDPALIESIGAWLNSGLTVKVTDQALLAQIVKGAKDADVRTTAVSLLNDQEFLARLATSSAGSDNRIRAAAVARLNDQGLLRKLAIEDKDHDVRAAAIEKLEDQDLIAKIAIEEPDEDLRHFAAGRVKSPAVLDRVGAWLVPERASRVTDQALLARIATEAKDEQVRGAATGALTDQAVLEKVALSDTSQNNRAIAAGRLTDQALLGKIAMRDHEQFVRGSAAEKLTDPAVLNEVGMWVKPELTARVTDQALLAKIVDNAKDASVRIAAVGALTDQDKLESIARSHDRERWWDAIRKAAIEKLTSQAAFEALASRDPDPEFRKLAASRLTLQEPLKRIALTDEHGEVRTAAVGQITGQDMLEELAGGAKWLDVRVAAIAKLDDTPKLREWAQTAPEAAIRQAAVKRIGDNAFLLARFSGESSAAVRGAIIETLREKDALRATARTAYYEQDRLAALMRLRNEMADPAPDIVTAHKELAAQALALGTETDAGRLADLALNARFDVLRIAATGKLSEPAGLERVALASTSREVLSVALEKIADRETLNRLAASAADPALRLAAAQKAGAASWERIFADASVRGGTAQALGDALAAVALIPKKQEDVEESVQQAALNLIRRGDESRIPEIADLLEPYGDKNSRRRLLELRPARPEQCRPSLGRAPRLSSSPGQWLQPRRLGQAVSAARGGGNLLAQLAMELSEARTLRHPAG